jgi:methionyl-tRNA formyltransferase
MKIVLLTHPDIEDADKLIDFMTSRGDDVNVLTERISMEHLETNNIEFLVSYSHRFLIKEPVLSEFDGRIINLHPSYLPYGKGYFPNFWSFVDGTPAGVTIHYIDEGIDTGDVIYKKELFFDEKKDTLKTTFYALKHCMHDLFMDNWESIKAGDCPRIPQNQQEGTLHYKKDFNQVAHLLPNGWDTNIGDVKQIDFLPTSSATQ